MPHARILLNNDWQKQSWNAKVNTTVYFALWDLISRNTGNFTEPKKEKLSSSP